MKTLNQFNEDAKKINAFMKNTVMKNPTVQSITAPLSKGQIDINNIKDTVTSEKGQKDLKNLRNTGLNLLIKTSQEFLDKASKKVNKK